MPASLFIKKMDKITSTGRILFFNKVVKEYDHYLNLSKGVQTMLTLSRRAGESLVFNDDIEVIVQEINRGHVKISIKAPNDVKILRKELYEKIEEGEAEPV